MNALKVTRQLRSIKLKNYLKSYICPNVLNYYDIAAVRVLIEESSDEIWLTRRTLEELFGKEEHIVGFISCLTALRISKPKKAKKRKNNEADDDDHDVEKDEEENDTTETDTREEDVYAGISFWVIFDWPQYGLQAYENHLAKTVLKANMNLISCKSIKGRGKTLLNHIEF